MQILTLLQPNLHPFHKKLYAVLGYNTIYSSTKHKYIDLVLGQLKINVRIEIDSNTPVKNR